jgi:hypothetical protein
MLAAQCEKHAEAVRAIAQRFEKNLSGSSGPQTPHNVMAGIRRKTSELLGHRPEPGLLLLQDQACLPADPPGSRLALRSRGS